ncbi:hypothetical protein TNCV_2485931 [Trichonephila clavipes]|uniref:Uncharacterized protein n=1 Tax=Trichonephila clavipes TaxID=2585209 RepID=A0A8X7BB86_TRICX|nr:hypothetical protein TNCV_2485931 [Trichonephila clavipes]
MVLRIGISTFADLVHSSRVGITFRHLDNTNYRKTYSEDSVLGRFWLPSGYGHELMAAVLKELMHIKSLEVQCRPIGTPRKDIQSVEDQSLYVSVGKKFGARGAWSGVVLVTSLWLQISKSFTIRSRVVLKREVAEQSCRVYRGVELGCETLKIVCSNLKKSATETYEMLKHVYGTERKIFSGIKISEKVPKCQSSGRPQTSHTAENIEKFSATVRKNMLQTTVLPHSPYSSDFAPCSFRIFLELASHLQSSRFQSSDKSIVG